MFFFDIRIDSVLKIKNFCEEATISYNLKNKSQPRNLFIKIIKKT